MLFRSHDRLGLPHYSQCIPSLRQISLDRIGAYVVAGAKLDKPRADLKRPWNLVRRVASLKGLRIHDLRHTYASFGAGGGLGLPIIGKLLGHSQAATTAPYGHLDSHPLHAATET